MDPGPCVLVVDNDPVHRELAAALLQIALPNAAVTGAACGFEALISIGQQDFDLVIADVVMSNMNGFKMLRHMAAFGPQRPRWQLATSSHRLAELRELGSLPADVGFLHKPWNVDDLLAWLGPRFAA
jgi:CheY-like chemotaxis protein